MRRIGRQWLPVDQRAATAFVRSLRVLAELFYIGATACIFALHSLLPAAGPHRDNRLDCGRASCDNWLSMRSPYRERRPVASRSSYFVLHV
jgi:hypothetical protein